MIIGEGEKIENFGVAIMLWYLQCLWGGSSTQLENSKIGCFSYVS